MTKEETDKVCRLLFKNGHAMNAKFVGRSPEVIGQAAGISVPAGTTVLIGEQGGVGEDILFPMRSLQQFWHFTP